MHFILNLYQKNFPLITQISCNHYSIISFTSISVTFFKCQHFNLFFLYFDSPVATKLAELRTFPARCWLHNKLYNSLPDSPLATPLVATLSLHLTHFSALIKPRKKVKRIETRQPAMNESQSQTDSQQQQQRYHWDPYIKNQQLQNEKWEKKTTSSPFIPSHLMPSRTCDKR